MSRCKSLNHCDYCNDDFCENCSGPTCSVCRDSSVCEDCLKKCCDCGEQICPSCLNEKQVCKDCEDYAKEKKEDGEP